MERADAGDDTPVSRETPPTPALAAEFFPADRLALVERYAGALSDGGVVRGLIGPREVPRLWERHLLNCAALGEVLPEGSRVADIGSGAGLPGLVLAIARPDIDVTLVEPLLRRTTFLEEVVAELALTRVHVVRGRADALHGQATFDVVTSRAVAPLSRLLEWSMPLVSATGVLAAMKGSSVGHEIVEAAPQLARLGCADPEVLELGQGRLVPAPTALLVSWADPERVGWRPVHAAGSGTRPAKGRRGRSGGSRRR